MKYSEQQFNKLPKWAQIEITSLENNVESLTKSLKEYQGKAETNSFIIDGLDRIPIQNNAQIQFRVGEKGENRATFYVRHDGLIDVNTDCRGAQSMVIMPRAANSFYIKFV